MSLYPNTCVSKNPAVRLNLFKIVFLDRESQFRWGRTPGDHPAQQQISCSLYSNIQHTMTPKKITIRNERQGFFHLKILRCLFRSCPWWDMHARRGTSHKITALSCKFQLSFSALKEPSGNRFCSSFCEWQLLSNFYFYSMKLKEQLRPSILINLSPVETKEKEPGPRTGKTLKFKNDLCQDHRDFNLEMSIDLCS